MSYSIQTRERTVIADGLTFVNARRAARRHLDDNADVMGVVIVHDHSVDAEWVLRYPVPPMDDHVAFGFTDQPY